MRVIEAVHLTTDLDPFLSLTGLAGYSSLSKRTLSDLVNDPRDPLPSYRVGGKILVRRSDFDGWMERFRARGRPDVVRALQELGLDGVDG